MPDMRFAFLAILRRLTLLQQQMEKLMSLGQDILDAVTAENTAVDSFLTLAQGLIDNGTIPADVGQKILAAISAEKDKVNAAILANTPQAAAQSATADATAATTEKAPADDGQSSSQA